MTALLTGLHPSFDALSAFADQADVDAARSRVGRHVARCATCRARVDEIRAMGDAARAVEMPAAPAGLWDAIDRARRDAIDAAGDTPALSAPVTRVAPSTTVSRRPPAVRRAAVGLLAAAGVIGLLLLPSPFHGTLDAASGRGRWSFTPGRPSGAQLVRVRFTPPPSMPPLGRLLLLARPVDGRRDTYDAPPSDVPVLDSVATLTRADDGTYAGAFTTPADFSALQLRLAAPGEGFLPVHADPGTGHAGASAARPAPGTFLVARSSDGRPRLDALTAIALLAHSGQHAGTEDYSVADTLIRYYPSEPIGYAVMERVGGRRLLDDVIAWFHRGERQYARFSQRYDTQRTVSADRELAMMVLANRIAEPTAARGWVMRLAREHPEDSRALVAYSLMLHEMFDEPGTGPLIRRGLPLADTLWTRNGGRGPADEMASIADRVGDTAAFVRWTARTWESVPLPVGFRGVLDPRLLRDPSVWSPAARVLTRAVSSSCTLSPGRYPLGMSREHWQSWCVGRKREEYASLSLLRRLQGQPRQALAYADTAVRLAGFEQSCFFLSPQRRRGEALLALGDTAAALPDLALRAAGAPAYADSVFWMIRSSVDSATWSRALVAGRDSVMRCRVADAERRRLESLRLRAAGAPPYYR